MNFILQFNSYYDYEVYYILLYLFAGTLLAIFNTYS